MRDSWKTTQPQSPRRWQAPNPWAAAIRKAETTLGNVKNRQQEQVPHQSNRPVPPFLPMTRFYRFSKPISTYLIWRWQVRSLRKTLHAWKKANDRIHGAV